MDALETRGKLTEGVLAEMDRVWGEGFFGFKEQYEWLLENYGITEHEDLEWQYIVEYYGGVDTFIEHMEEEGEGDSKYVEERLKDVRDDQSVIAFLELLLSKYRSNTTVYVY